MSHLMDETQFLKLSTELDQQWRTVQDWIRDYPMCVVECLKACDQQDPELFVEMVANSPNHRCMFQNHIILAVKEAEYRRQLALRDDEHQA
jgi:hypothetical protein